MITVNQNPSAAELRKFGWAMLLGFGVIGAVLWYFGPQPNALGYVAVRQQKIALGLWIVGVVLLIISYGPAAISRPIYVTWMTVGMYLGTVMTFVLLSVLFVVLLPWFSLIRLSDPLGMKLKPKGESYWRDHVDQQPELDRVARPF